MEQGRSTVTSSEVIVKSRSACGTQELCISVYSEFSLIRHDSFPRILAD